MWYTGTILIREYRALICKKESNFLVVDNFQAIFQHSISPFIVKLCTFIRNFRVQLTVKAFAQSFLRFIYIKYLPSGRGGTIHACERIWFIHREASWWQNYVRIKAFFMQIHWCNQPHSNLMALLRSIGQIAH